MLMGARSAGFVSLAVLAAALAGCGHWIQEPGGSWYRRE